MRILLVNDYGTPTGVAENQILRLRALLRERGHDARLFSSWAIPVPASLEADYSCFGSTSQLRMLSQTVNPSAYFNFRKVLREFRPDVVHVRMFLWQLSPAILPLLWELPAIYQTATYKSICPLGTRILPDGTSCTKEAGKVCLSAGCLSHQAWATMMLQRKLWLRWRRAFDAIVALSKTMKDRLEENGIRPVEVIYNGVRERPLRPALEATPLIAFAGRLAPEKGIFVLLDALRELHVKGMPFRFVAAGDGPLRDRFLARVSELGLNSKQSIWGSSPRSN